MRSEQEMLELIVDTAKRDGRIRAVIMNGSRANPNAPQDIFRDFDIVYIVGKYFQQYPKCEGDLLKDNNATEQEREHSEQNWKMMLDGLKKFLEK